MSCCGGLSAAAVQERGRALVDEAAALLSRGAIVPELTDLLAEIAQEMRKVAVFALCIGQQFKADIMDSAVRNSFVSMISCRARREVARVQSGSNDFGKQAESLSIGQAVWLTPSGETIRIAVPNTTQQHIVAVAHYLASGSTPHANEAEQSGATSHAPITPSPLHPLSPGRPCPRPVQERRNAQGHCFQRLPGHNRRSLYGRRPPLPVHRPQPTSMTLYPVSCIPNPVSRMEPTP